MHKNGKQFTILVFTSILALAGAAAAQDATVTFNPGTQYQEFDGFGDTSQYEQVIATYNTLSVAQREEVLDLLFTTKQPHYMGWKMLMFLWFPDILDANGNPIPRAANPAAENRMWFLEGAYARGVKLIWRGTTEPQYRYMDGNGLVWMTPGTEAASAQLKARIINAAESLYNIRVSMIDPVNEPDSDWWTSLQYGDVCMSKEQVVTYLRACRVALDAAGLSRIEIIPYDAGYSMRTEYLDYILASDVGAGLQHLGFHGYNPSDASLQHWNSAVNVARGKKCYQTEWGDWTQTAPEQAHGQAMEYARRISQSIFQAKVSGWFDWEHAFIFDLTATGWNPHEAAYVIAQYSRFIDPGMRMVQTNDMWSNNGTMAFLAPGSGQRDFSFITFYPGATPVTVRYDLSTLPGVKLLRNARQTTAGAYFQALSPAVSGDGITVTLPAQSVTSFRVSVGGDGSAPPPDPTPNPSNHAPTAVDNLDYQGPLTGTFTIAAPGVLANDTDPDGDALTAVLVNNYITGLGNLTLNADGSFTVELTSARTDGDILGFTYKAVDPSGAESAAATVLITLHAAAQPEPDPTPSTGTYYVDSVAGNDSYNGTSEATPWRTFTNVNGRTFQPGNQILLKRGGAWYDTLWPLGSGSSGSPITLGAYGTGALPKIYMQTRDYGILMRNMQYWVIQNIEVVGGYPNVNHSGIYITNEAGGVLTYFRITNCVVHDVGGEYSIPFDRGGIVMGVGRISDIVVDGCTVYNIHSDGAIEVGGSDSIYSRSTGLTVRNCTTYNTFPNACAGILPVNIDNVLVEHNTVYGLDGIWTWNSTNALMQFNEVYNTTCFTGGDGGGIHIDYYCNDNTIQYNYIHDCGGYSTCLYGADTSGVGGTHAITKNGVIRYNILANNARESGLAYQGDILAGTFSNGGIDGAKIYNNTIIANVNHNDGFVLNTGSAITNSIFKNNIVYSATPRMIRNWEGGFSLDNNIYFLTSGTPVWSSWGSNYYSLGAWQATGQDAYSRYQNPLLGNAAYHTTGTWPTTQFALQPGSPAINAGANVGSMGSRDFLGNAIPQETAYDIGACESGGAGPAPIYTLTVNSGTGDGSYAAGAQVSITADAAPAGQGFDRWTGDTGALASATSATTTVTMPTANVTVTATYVSQAPQNHAPTGTIDLDFEGTTTGTFTIEAPGVLANDTDPDGDALTAVLVNNYITGLGILTLNSDGSFNVEITYSGFKDGDLIGFTYKAVDPSGAESAETTVLVTLRAAPQPEPTIYTLTVNSGTGDGTYASGTEVSVTADAAPAGQVFDRWTGDTGALASTTSATTTVTMPALNVTVTATYVNQAPVTYTLTVNSGTGDGTYAAGAQVSVAADAAPAGQVFDRWTGDTGALASATSATTTVTMPASNVTVTATYVNQAPVTYTLTVNSGTGDGSYAAGAQVSITANAAPAGQVFDRWTGDTGALASATSATTTVTMPAGNVTVTATYVVQAPTTYALTVNSGTGDGTYAAGAQVSITANAAPAGQVFDRWTGDTGALASATSATTTVTMPVGNVTVTATYVNQAPPPEPEPNAAPVGYTDNYEAPLGGTLTIDAPGFLSNDTDADGDALTAVLVNDYTAGLGNLTFNADGSFTFEPTFAFFQDGDLISFTYRAVDASGAQSAETPVLITLRDAAPAPEPPPDPTPDPNPTPQPDPPPQVGLPDIGGGSAADGDENGDHAINDTLCGGTIGSTGMPGLWIPLAGMVFAFWPRKRR